MKNTEQLRQQLAIAFTPQIGPRRYQQLQQAFPDLKDLWRLTPKAYAQRSLAPQLRDYLDRANWAAADSTLRWASAPNHHILSLDDPNYPKLLKHIADPPPFLMVKGHVEVLNSPQLGMVGSRKPTPVGRENAFVFAKALSEEDLCITSGLAYGIDAASHEGALAGSGKTIAVLGAGIEKIYPKRHQSLADAITEQGALVSEYPVYAQARVHHFPQRNRLISGMSQGVLIPEATVRSGSLITANFALEQGREVFALPGSIHNPLSKGCHQLIRSGAILVECLDDILSELNTRLTAPASPRSMPRSRQVLDNSKQKLVECVAYETTSVDQVIKRSHYSPNLVNSLLIELECEGHVMAVPGGYVRIAE